MRRVFFLIAVMAAGCASMRERARCGTDRAGEVCVAAYEQLACSTEFVRVYEAKDHWRATGCGREVHCDTVRREWVCTPAMSSEQRAKAALTVRSGCKDSSLVVLAIAPSGDGYGTWRLGGCGGPWLCAVTETTAECTPAEDWRPADQSPVGAGQPRPAGDEGNLLKPQ